MRINYILYLAFIAIAFSNPVFAQDSDDDVDYNGGHKVGIDVYYGTPMFFQWIVGTAVATDLGLDYTNKSVKNGGPMGFRFEYFASEDFGIGIDLGYNSVTASAQRTESIYDPATNTTTETRYTDEFNSSKIGAVVTFNIRLFQVENFQASGVVGVGYGVRQYNFSSTDPSYNEAESGLGSGLVNAPIAPVSFRLGMIARYYFTPNVGLNMGLGIGQGGLLNGGLSFRF